MIVWDPFASVLSLSSQCVECNQPVQHNAWKIGQSQGLQPRILHDIDSIVVIVSCQYRCTNKHVFLTTDPRVLRLIPAENIPLILLHRTGLMKSFCRKIIGLVGEGMSISAVERFIKQQRRLSVAVLVTQVKNKMSLGEGEDLHCNTPLLLEAPYPSNDLLYKCFLTDFVLNNQRYTSAMSKISAENIICFDHTFKVASNIGYLRSDAQWVTQYSSVFIVMNEKGMVMAWQFTKTTSMDEVHMLLLHVKDRVNDKDRLTVLVDNCCGIRGKLAEVFGSNVTIKLDLFHAIQRISKKMAKRHPLYHMCINDLRLVFRQPTDLGHDRKLSTPSPNDIITNLDKFMRKWKSMESQGSKIINDNVLKEIECLKVHITKGCLSNIPAGAGTNRNERLHRYIRPHFSQTRLGLPLALALMTVLLYQHNSTLMEKITGNPAKLIVYEPLLAHQLDFGITNKSVHQSLWGIDTLENISSLSHTDFEDIAKTASLQECISHIITIEEITCILENSIHLYSVTKSMSQKECSLMNYQFFPFMSSLSSLFFSKVSAPTDSNEECPSELDSLITSWKMKRISILGDGNCCFSAVAHGLLNTPAVSSLNRTHPELNLSSVGVLSQQLRQIVVKEWKENADYYAAFLVDCNVREEADKFLQSGWFDSDLGDTVLLALANSLGVHFVVFTTLECHPLVHVTPKIVLCNCPVYLAYTHRGCGHYDAVMESSDTTNQEPPSSSQEQSESCTCGKNLSTSERMHCTEIATKYTTIIRCACLKSGRKCTVKCRCRNCGNEYGTRPNSSDTETPSRKRRKRTHQIKVPKSSIFGATIGEEMENGKRTILEFFILEGILQFFETSPL